MGKIKELREKVKAGEATDEEVVELEELETEAAETDAEESKEEEKEEEKEDKSIKAQVKELADAMKEIVNSNIEDAKEKAVNLYGKDKTDIDTSKMKKGEKTVEFIKALINGAKEKLQVMSEGTAANGGYLVPEEWQNEIVEDILDATVIRPRATVVQMTTDTLHLPQLATRPHVYWTAEKAVKSTSTATFTEITFTPYTLAVIVVLTKQLVADASVGVGSGIISYVTRLVVQAIGAEEDRVFINGAGTTQPTGITAYTLGSTASAGGALTGDHLINAYYRLEQGYRRTAVWIMNSRTIAHVKRLKDSQNRYLFMDALTAGGYPTVLGAPVIEQNDLASATVLFGDLSRYYIAQREGISMAQSEDATVAGYSMFERNEVAVRVEERLDGELVDVKAFTSITSTGVS